MAKTKVRWYKISKHFQGGLGEFQIQALIGDRMPVSLTFSQRKQWTSLSSFR
jgi:hypothetical protein